MKRVLPFVLMLLIAVPALGRTRDAFVTAYVNLRAGPYVDYPLLTEVPAGMMVTLYGCLDDWSWCDVGYDGDRGWISASYLSYDYDGRRVYLPEYGVRIGIPVVTFSLSLYWRSHYIHRPWYRDRSHWEQVERSRMRRLPMRPAERPIPRNAPSGPHPEVRPAYPNERQLPARTQERTVPTQVIRQTRTRQESLRVQERNAYAPKRVTPPGRTAPRAPANHRPAKAPTRTAPPKNKDDHRGSGGGGASLVAH